MSQLRRVVSWMANRLGNLWMTSNTKDAASAYRKGCRKLSQSCQSAAMSANRLDSRQRDYAAVRESVATVLTGESL